MGVEPRGLTFSPGGEQLFVTTSSSDEIYVLDAASYERLGTFAAAGGPRGISVVEAPTAAVASTAVGGAEATPGAWALSDVFPNPFNPETHLTLSLPAGGDVTLEIFNAVGQRIRRIELDQRLQGRHVLSWDGRDDGGTPVASGVYLFVVRLASPAAPIIATRKGVLLR